MSRQRDDSSKDSSEHRGIGVLSPGRFGEVRDVVRSRRGRTTLASCPRRSRPRRSLLDRAVLTSACVCWATLFFAAGLAGPGRAEEEAAASTPVDASSNGGSIATPQTSEPPDDIAAPEELETMETVEPTGKVQEIETVEETETIQIEEEPAAESWWSQPSPADDSRSSSPPPPLGVRMGEPLAGGQVRLAYSFERIYFHGLDDHGRDLRQDQVVYPGSFYQQAPTDLQVTVHDFQLAYAPHPRVTLVVDVPFIEKDLNRFGVNGRRHDHTEGIGDLEFSMIVPFIRKGREFSQVHIGVGAPTGSIRRGGDVKRLPYDNQIGNGTWDLEWGWTYRGEADLVSWGAQMYGHHPIGRNGLHWREGSLFTASMWSALKLFDGVSASLRFVAEKQNNIRGDDRSLDPAVDGPSSDSKKRGGFRLALNPGLTLEIPQLYHQRLSVEFGVPVFQSLDGPQLAQQWSVKAGWQWVF